MSVIIKFAMPACCVLNCISRNTTNQPGLTFHRFPKDEIIKTKWSEAIGSNNLDNLPKIRFVCSLHFEKNCFDEEGSLHDDAVPTIFNKHSNKRRKSIELDSDQESDRISEISSQSLNVERNRSCKKSKISGMELKPEKLSQYQPVMSTNATMKQVDALLSYLETHKGLARNTKERSRSKILWRRLTNELNNIRGGCVKNIKQWQKVWADKKYLARKASACVKSGKMSPGDLSSQEIRIIALIDSSDDKALLRTINKKARTEMDSDQESDRLSEISTQSFTAEETVKKNKERKTIETNCDNESNKSEFGIYIEEINITTTSTATSEQIETLLSFLEKNPGLARNTMRNVEARCQAKVLWETVTNELNAMGGCMKNVKQWQKVWADKKYLARKALASCQQAGSKAAKVLTPQELKILSIIEDTEQTEVDGGSDFRPVYIVDPEPQLIEKVELSPPNSPGLSLKSLSNSPQRELKEERTRRLSDDNVSEHSRTSSTADENNVNNRLIRMEERRLAIEVKQGKELAQIRQELSQLRQAVQELVGIFKSSLR